MCGLVSEQLTYKDSHSVALCREVTIMIYTYRIQLLRSDRVHLLYLVISRRPVSSMCSHMSVCYIPTDFIYFQRCLYLGLCMVHSLDVPYYV